MVTTLSSLSTSLALLILAAGFILPENSAVAATPGLVVVAPSNSQGILLSDTDTKSISTRLLDAPARLVVDIASRPGIDKSRLENQLPKEIRSIRVGFHEGFTRVVFDLSGESLPQLAQTRSSLEISFHPNSQATGKPLTDLETPPISQTPLITRLSFREVLSLSRRPRRPQDL